MEIKENRYSIFEANLFYLIIGISLLTLGSKAQAKEVMNGLLVTEYLIVFLPTLLFMKIRGYSIKRTSKLNKITFRQGVMVPFIVLFFYPMGVFLNYLMLLIISSFTNIVPPPVPIPDTPRELGISFLVIALSPGICEEFMFRGFIMPSYERLGRRKAIVYSALLFGIFHFNLQNLIGPIFLGLIFGIMVYKTNSFYTAIIGHATNNAISMFIGYMLSKNLETMVDAEVSQPAIDFQGGSYVLLSIVVLGVIAFVMGAIAFSLLKALPEGEKEEIDYYQLNHCQVDREKSIFKYIPVFIVIGIYIYINYIFFFS